MAVFNFEIFWSALNRRSRIGLRAFIDAINAIAANAQPLNENYLAAMDNASQPGSDNPFATRSDISDAITEDDLTPLEILSAITSEDGSTVQLEFNFDAVVIGDLTLYVNEVAVTFEVSYNVDAIILTPTVPITLLDEVTFSVEERTIRTHWGSYLSPLTNFDVTNNLVPD
jgi:hypothetical protein